MINNNDTDLLLPLKGGLMILHRKIHSIYVNVLQGVHFHLEFLTGNDSSCQNKYQTSLLSLWPIGMLIMSNKALALEGSQLQPERVKVK